MLSTPPPTPTTPTHTPFKLPPIPPTSLKGDPVCPPLFAQSLSLPSAQPQAQPQNKTQAQAQAQNQTQGQELLLPAVDPRALRTLLALMDMEATLHGAASHYGGPAALAEVVSALHAIMFHMAQQERKPWHHLFHFVNDAGHCENVLYALRACYGMAFTNLEKLQGFRSLQSSLTGHGEALHFPEGVLISNGPLGSALPQAQGLALADALLNNGRVTLCTISDGACMEGEAKESLAAIPGLCRQKKIAPFILIISDNNTKLSGRISEDSFSMEPTLKSLSALGWDLCVLEKGNDLQSCANLFMELLGAARKGKKGAIAIQAKTLKGIGTQATSQSASGGHGFPLKSIEELPAFIEEIYGIPLSKIPSELQGWLKQLQKKALKKAQASSSSSCSSSSTASATATTTAMTAVASSPNSHRTNKRQQGFSEKVQAGISRALIQAKEKGLPLFSLSADLAGSTGVKGFQKKFPECCLDLGVAEANMISTAIGLSKSGFIPIVDTFAQFGISKGALPLIMSGLSMAPIIALFSHAGLQDAADGASHQALTHFAMTASLPRTQVHSLSCSKEAEALLSQALDLFHHQRAQGRTPESFIFFLGRENFPPHLREGLTYKLETAQILADETSEKDKGRVTLVSCGPLLIECLKAAQDLKEKAIGAMVLNANSLHRPDTSTLHTCLKRTHHKLLVVEEHQMKGGLASLIGQALHAKKIPFELHAKGLEGEWGRSAYTAKDLYRHYGLDSPSLVKAAMEFCL